MFRIWRDIWFNVWPYVPYFKRMPVTTWADIGAETHTVIAIGYYFAWFGFFRQWKRPCKPYTLPSSAFEVRRDRKPRPMLDTIWGPFLRERTDGCEGGVCRL